MKVHILIGIPGSGKSTWVQKTKHRHDIVISADHFRTASGQYMYDPAKNAQVHGDCLQEYVETLQQYVHGGGLDVFVDNTNTKLIEVAPYVALAQAYGAEVCPVRLRCPVDMAFARNTHAVPFSAILSAHVLINAMVVEWPRHWPAIQTVWTDT